MAIFDWAEDDGAAEQNTPRAKKLSFGDGYEQRAPDGINNLGQKWDLRFSNCDKLYAQEIHDFLDARAGWEAFDWTPKWATSAIKVKCESWSRTPVAGDLVNVAATFERVYAV